MGNLIKDFWTYEYKEKNYFGVVEVVQGEDLAQIRQLKKYETHIDKALDFTMKNKVLSHMSIQTYCTWLKDKPCREDNEQKYYPFILEFESSKRKESDDVVFEVATYVNYLVREMSINKNDISIMINNSKSIYVFINPKVYAAKPEKDQHKIYYKMYQYFKKELSLKYVDESIVSSSYKLMKTPNSYYKGGYFVPITIDDLMQLLIGAKTREELTKERKSLDKEIPGIISLKASKLYSDSVKAVKYGDKKIKTEDTTKEFKCNGTCVKYLQEHMIEAGYRNFGLVSVGIYLKSIGNSKDEVQEKLVELGARWNHDESSRAIASKVNSIFRRDYKFSCKYAKSVFDGMGIENMCDKCPCNRKNKDRIIDGIDIDANIINALWSNKASTRHYVLYLNLVSKNLFNRAFTAADEGIDERTLRELSKYACFKREKKDGQVIITYRSSKRIYRLPEEFLESTVDKLGESIKQYLRIFVKGYKANNKYIIIRSSLETLMDDLNYKEVSSVYKLMKKLSDIGLVKHFVKTSTITLYYNSYKVIKLEDIKKDTMAAEDQREVVGEQLRIEQIELINKMINLNKKSSVNLYRGSPPENKNPG